MSRKGPAWERKFCTLLSDWWTGGSPDCVFWRTANSGGRATVRGRKGQHTSGQHGDIAHTAPSGEAFCRAFTVELKKGYNKATLIDLVDKPGSCVYREWIDKLRNTASAAGSLSWMLVHHRDRREPLVFLEGGVAQRLWEMQGHLSLHGVRELSAEARYDDGTVSVWGTRLEDFFRWVHPHMIRNLLEN